VNEQTQRILHERALALAREPARTEPSEAMLEVVEFLLGAEHYAVETAAVRETQPLKDLTPLPCAPSFLAGVVNIRGRILAVVDLKRLFEVPASTVARAPKIIILHGSDSEFGLLADEVLGTRKLSRNALQPSLPTLGGIRAEYLKGVTGERLVLLDAERLLSDEKLVVNEEVG